MNRTSKNATSEISRAEGSPAPGLTRRMLLGSAGALAGLPLLPACGGSTEDDTTTAMAPADDGRAHALALAPAVAAARGLWLARPAEEWLQALPIGNGRLGAMLFSGTSVDRVQFNENSLWGGGNNYSGDGSDGGFGPYMNFGEFRVDFSSFSPTGPVGQPGEDISKTIDGSTSTKWCVQTTDAVIPWQVELPQPAAVSSYALTSANDVPARDPLGWTLYGSDDNANWTALHTVSLSAPFEQRLMTKSYSFSNSRAWRFYRFAFQHNTSVSHFQLSEVRLDGVALDDTAGPSVSSPSGHGGEGNYSPNEEISSSVDGNPSTKWCVGTGDAEVLWQYDNRQAVVITNYSLTSANDVPQRDPKGWTLLGSNDGVNWTTLDTRQPGPAFTARLQKLDFSFSNSTAYRFFRFKFQHDTAASHFQVADVTVNGVNGFTTAGKPALANYERRLDIHRGLHTVAYRRGGQRYTREAFASRPDDVMAFRYTAVGNARLNGRITLTSAQQNAPTVAPDATRLEFQGTHWNNLRHSAVLRVLADGPVTVDGNSLRLSNCTTLTLLLDAATDYKPDYWSQWRTGAEPLPVARDRVSRAASTGWDALRTRHLNDFSPRMARVEVTWGGRPVEQRHAAADRPAAPGLHHQPHRHRPRADDVRLRSLPAHQLVAPGWPAGQPARPVERQQQPGVAERLPQQHQRADELLGRRDGRPR